MIRKLDRMFFRVKRNGKWVNLCVSDMTDEELRENIYDKKSKEFLEGVITNLVHTLKKIGDDFELTTEIPEEDDGSQVSRV
jgi:hypothetical protein